MVTNYPFVILNTDINIFFANEVFHYFDIGTFSCQVQGSHLTGRKKRTTKQVTYMLESWFANHDVSSVEFLDHIAFHKLITQYPFIVRDTDFSRSLQHAFVQAYQDGQ